MPFVCSGADKHEGAIDGHVEQVPHRNKKSLGGRQITQAAEKAEAIKTNDSSKERLKLVTAVRSRGARMAKAKLVEEEQKATASCEESSVASAPARGRRGKKPEATAPPVVQRSTRGRNARIGELVEQSSTLSSKVASKPTGGQKAKKASDDPDKIISKVVEAEIVPEPEGEQATSVNFREQATENLTAVEKAKGGKRTKQPDQLVPEKDDNDSVPRAGNGLLLTFIIKQFF